MSVISWILLILFLLVAGSAIVILIVDLFIEDPNNNIIPVWVLIDLKKNMNSLVKVIM
jgi:hypothetical protein